MNFRYLNTYVFICFILHLLPAIAEPNPAITTYFGTCDASAAVAISNAKFIVADDESNIIRVYKNGNTDKPISTFDLTSFLDIDPKKPETDIEAATIIGNRIYWITSHGTNSNGKLRPNRRRFFITEFQENGDVVSLKPIGTPYRDLVNDLGNAPELREYTFANAATIPPEAKGGLNIEGMTITKNNTLLLAFRNPLTADGKALLVPLQNPNEVVEGKPAKLGSPIYLFLAGRGIRSIEYSKYHDKYFIIAGSYDDESKFSLYEWSGGSSEQPTLLTNQPDFHGLTPEALFIDPENSTQIQILSDDGTEQIKGQNCKDLTNSTDKYFRSIFVNVLQKE